MCTITIFIVKKNIEDETKRYYVNQNKEMRCDEIDNHEFISI